MVAHHPNAVRPRSLVAKFWPMLIVAALLASTASYGRILLKASRKVVEDGEQFSFTVEANSRDEFNKIRTIPGLDRFEALSKSTSTRMQVVNGRFNAVLSRTYILRAKKPGRHTLGPVKVRVGRKTVTSRPLTITVKKVAVDPNKPKTFFLKAATLPASGYVNQQLTYVLKLYFLESFYRPQLGPPSFKGFWREGEHIQRDYIERVGEVSYKVKEIRLALFPQKLGQITIEPATFTFEVPVNSSPARPTDPFMAVPTRRVTLKSNPVAILVKAIPNVGLSSPYVGRLSLQASPLPDTAKVGDSISIELKVSGTGNVRDIEAPKLTVAGARVYDDKPELSHDQDSKGVVTGSKVFRLAVVPERPGPLKIPPLSFAALDPATGKLRRVQTAAKTITITGAASVAGGGSPGNQAATSRSTSPTTSQATSQAPKAAKPPASAAKQPVAVLARDIATAPLAGPAKLRPLHQPVAGFRIVYGAIWVVLGIIGLWFIAELLMPRLRHTRAIRRKRRRALPTALKKLAAGDSPADGVGPVFREYLSTMLQHSFAAASASDMVSAVASLKSVPASVVDGLRRCLETSDAERFSAKTTPSAATNAATNAVARDSERSEARALLKTLDRALS